MMVTKEGFLRWLLSKPAHDVVGLRGRPCDCPIATFLRENGHPEARVYARHYYPAGRGGPTWLLDYWAHRVIDAVDYGPREHVTADEMLVIMSRLENAL